MRMTMDEAKRDLPDVKVKMPNGVILTGKVSGRKNKFPTVSVFTPEYGAFSFETSWAQIAWAATDDTAINYC
jgi:hypothetical protein